MSKKTSWLYSTAITYLPLAVSGGIIASCIFFNFRHTHINSHATDDINKHEIGYVPVSVHA